MKKGPFKLRSGNKPSVTKLSGVVETKQDNTRAPNVRTDIVVDNKATKKRVDKIKDEESSRARRTKTMAESEYLSNLRKYKTDPTPQLYKKIQAYRKLNPGK